MAKLKYSKTLYKLRKQPELPDWYRYLQIFIGVVVAIAFLLHLISPSKHANTVNLVTNTITSSGVNTYKPTPVNSNNNQFIYYRCIKEWYHNNKDHRAVKKHFTLAAV